MPEDFVVRSDGAISAEMDGEVVALDVAKGVCYALNVTGSRIWSLIETPVSVADICSKLLAEFKVDPLTCEREVLGLLQSLRSEGLVRLLSPGAAASSSA